MKVSAQCELKGEQGCVSALAQRKYEESVYRPELVVNILQIGVFKVKAQFPAWEWT